MNKQLEASELLQKPKKIPMECSDTEDSEFSDIEDGEFSEYEESEPEEKKIEICSDNSNSDINSKENEASESKPEKILNICERSRTRVLSSSENETENVQASPNERIQEGSASERLSLHNTFEDTSGPTGYAKRNIMKDKVISAFSLLIDSHILQRIIFCTESKASRVLDKKWTLTETKLKAFLGILYARGAYEAKNLKLSYLWNTKWGPSFFSSTMSRNEFVEILKFIRFEEEDDRSQRLKNDKFALISTVWDKFIENNQNCYKPGANITIEEQLFPTKARCSFKQHLSNNSDKFGIKFWLTFDVQTKYVVNGFPYLGKSEKGLPETAEFYNKKKFDQMTKKYSVKFESRRWSLQVFFIILDLAGINAWILYKETTGEQISRKDFMFQLADELVAGNEKSRIGQRVSEIQSTSKYSPYPRKSCQIGYCNNNKTNAICDLCQKHVCGKCTQKKLYVCKKCDE
ncbi:uncharacterized protein [Bombus fervidus]|uniref:uncharacterized protein n=1 Tax=Bombus fervidus TaxID=203811 RepID=UPI003AB397A9